MSRLPLRHTLAGLAGVVALSVPTVAWAAERSSTDGASGTPVPAAHTQTACAGLNGDPFARTELFFGLNKPDGKVSSRQFDAFIDAEVTPRFPDGLTVLAGNGQFRDSSNTIIEEKSRLLILLYTPTPESSAQIDAIRDAYKTAFEQQSVLRVDEASCVSF